MKRRRFTKQFKLEILREKGLKVSGSKSELINRLANNCNEHMKSLTKGMDLYICTQKGIDLVEAYLNKDKARKEHFEKLTVDYLTKRNFDKAIEEFVVFESSQVFPRGLFIDWDNYNKERDIKILNYIFSRTPKIIGDIKNEIMEKIRIDSAMMYLLGDANIKPYLIDKNTDIGLKLNINVVCRMLWFHARHLYDLDDYEDTGIEKVEISGCGDETACTYCKEQDKKIYDLKTAPELPFQYCTNELGCRCIALAVLDKY